MKTWFRTLLVALGMTAILAAATHGRAGKALERLELMAYDARMRATAGSRPASPDIVLCLVDQVDLDDFRVKDRLEWPWPRQLHAAAVRFFHKAGAKAVVFDMVFSESSRFGADDDRAFAEAVREAGNVFFAVPFSRKRTPDFSASSLERFALPPGPAGPSFLEAVLPVPELLEAAKGIGNVTVEPDPDGVYRRVPLSVSLEGKRYPALSAAVAGVSSAERFLIGFPKEGSYRPDRSWTLGNVILSYRTLEDGGKPFLDPARFRDKIVLVGASAAGLYDLKTTPMKGNFPGVAVHAAALDSLLSGRRIRDLSEDKPWLLGLTCLGALLAAWAGTRRSLWLSLGLCILLMGGLAFGATAAFARGAWIPAAAPLLGMAGAFAVSSSLHYALETRRRKEVERAFAYYLAPSVIDDLARHPEALRLGGEQRELSVLFSDIEGFTAISERMQPDRMVALLNEYLSEMSDCILSRQGTLDKYIGDAIMAFWGAPLPQKDHAARACGAALDCARKLRTLGASLEKRELPVLRARIGINTGLMTVGNMGSRARFDYTVHGDAVNLASRLEAAAKRYGNAILIGEGTYRAAGKGIVARELDLIRVAGRRQPVRVYELLGRAGEDTMEVRRRIQTFHEGLAAYRLRRWAEARKAFEALRDEDGDDKVLRLYLDRIADYALAPPPEKWDGVHEIAK